jgi:hypothetical protein
MMSRPYAESTNYLSANPCLLLTMPPLLGGHEGLRDEVQFLSLIQSDCMTPLRQLSSKNLIGLKKKAAIRHCTDIAVVVH